MRPLLPSDPARVGRHRLLGRLGAGGMGVVYLGRTDQGALAAVKVVRAAYADDPGFRARFAREVRAAGRVRSPWVVPLLGAGTRESTPWLATAYVPGPSVAEAVEECGPLPLRSARVLGARLAEALRDVHAAGLVHRDVKPANVLLALDGPRLIDFGIAREQAGTALTATGTVVGSPGFLSPEQARGTGAGVGPPSDVFSLGCLLAFAVSGHRPFGDGSPAAVLVRTAYEEPELDGVPGDMAALVRSCLAKEPGDRPTAAELCAALGGAPPAQDWLPGPVVRLIARRSAAALALPAVPPTTLDGRGAAATRAAGDAGAGPAAEEAAGAPTEPAIAPPRPGLPRRRLLLGAAGVLAAGGGAAVWWASGRGRQPAAAVRETLVLALHADLSGPGKALGTAQERGARLALEEFNSRAEHGLRLDLLVRDDRGDPRRAQEVAEELSAHGKVLAVLGPSDEDCAAAVVERYQKALLSMVSVSLGRLPTKGLNTQRVFVATRPVDDALGAPLAVHLVHTVDSRHTVFLADAELGATGWTVCSRTADVLGASNRSERWTVEEDTDARGFAALAGRVVDSGADAVVFVGGARRAADVARALPAAGFEGARLGTHHAVTPSFLGLAGRDAEGWVFATPFLDPLAEESTGAFATAYRRRFGGADPAWYAAEAYDAALFLAGAVTELDAIGYERGGLVRQLRETRYEGVTKALHFDPDTATYNQEALYLFAVEGGGFVYRGRASGGAR
ncbi:bifunctional serine/threonine-protein kinase/ABC transporter substrate-binding protein [Streptomyces sp. NPDC090026]|uniref:bifunctional serine/threonine-protein kinase/ABC transporter substrate-binding protein n=1 Tax=Streptomyces sp. NPDC090026 TaxID=3365923 RepID=UPI00382BB1CD